MGLIIGLSAGGIISLGLLAWAAYGRTRPPPVVKSAQEKFSSQPVSSVVNQVITRPLDPVRLKTIRAEVTDRVWTAAFGIQSLIPPDSLEILPVRDYVIAALQAATVNPRHLPRRPHLMQRLVATINDPQASREKVARIISQDPVLAADVLRLSNSPLYRLTRAPIESVQRAITICGGDGLQALLVSALVQPIFRASSKNFPLFAELLWKRSEQSARVAEIYASEVRREDRFEAQLLALLSALGPLAVYRVILDFYAKTPSVAPNPAVCKALILEFGPRMAHRVAVHWETSQRLLAALCESAEEGLCVALNVGELLGSIGLLESCQLLSAEAYEESAVKASLPPELTAHLKARLQGKFTEDETAFAPRKPAPTSARTRGASKTRVRPQLVL